MYTTTEKCLVCGGQVALGMSHSDYCIPPTQSITHVAEVPIGELSELKEKIIKLEDADQDSFDRELEQGMLIEVLRDEAVELKALLKQEGEYVAVGDINKFKADAIREMADKLTGINIDIFMRSILEYADNLERK